MAAATRKSRTYGDISTHAPRASARCRVRRRLGAVALPPRRAVVSVSVTVVVMASSSSCGAYGGAGHRPAPPYTGTSLNGIAHGLRLVDEFSAEGADRILH